MKGAELGAKRSLSCGSINQAVVPATGLPSAPVQSKAAPPQSWTSIPKCRLYQARSDGASLALKKMPPMPVTRFIVLSIFLLCLILPGSCSLLGHEGLTAMLGGFLVKNFARSLLLWTHLFDLVC